MRAWRSPLLALTVGVACHPSQTTLTVPDEVTRVAWIDLNDGGFEASALLDLNGAAVWSIEGGRRIEFVGFGEDVAAAMPDEASAEALVRADECEPRLDTPLWIATSQGTAIEVEDLPALTAPWVLAVCATNDYAPPGILCEPCGDEDCHAVEVDVAGLSIPDEPIFDLVGIQVRDAATAFAVPRAKRALVRLSIPESAFEEVPPQGAVLDGIAPEDFAGRYVAYDGERGFVAGLVGAREPLLRRPRRVVQFDRDGRYVRQYDFAAQDTSFALTGPRRTSGSGPVFAHFVGGPVIEFTATTTIARDDLPNAIGLAVVDHDEIAVVTDTELIWRRADDEVRINLPAPYAEQIMWPQDRHPRAQIFGDDIVMIAPSLPVYRWTRGAAGWTRLDWPTGLEQEALGMAALRDGYVVVGRLNTRATFLFEEHDRSCRMSAAASPTIAVDSTADAQTAYAVTGALTSQAQLVRLRSRRRR